MEEKQLILENLGFTWPDSPDRKPVFSCLSAEIPLVRPAVVLGANGSGKTTLARLSGGLDSPDKGKIIFRGEDWNKSREIEKKLERGVVFETPDFQFQTLTVKDELTVGMAHLGASPAGQRKALETAETRFGLAAWVERPVQFLEAGEKLAVLCAAFLLLEVELLILDFSLAELEENFRAVLLDTACSPGGPSLLVFTRSAADLVLAGREASYLLLENGCLEKLDLSTESAAFLGRLKSAGIRLEW